MSLRIIFSVAILVFTALVVLAVAAFLVMEALSKIEEVRKRMPRFVGYAESRKTLTHLLSVAIILMVGNGWELLTKEVPEIPRLPSIKLSPPIIQVTSSTVAVPTIREPKNSLRRRTMQLADEIEKYIVMRASDPSRPPIAVPNSSEPNPSEERKKAIERYRKYEQETLDYYFAHYRDRMIGIIREYNAKGMRTWYLESDARQRPPIFVMPGSVGEGMFTDDLYQFRELAYHVDGEGNLIVITP
jgi:hypothetical protein